MHFAFDLSGRMDVDAELRQGRGGEKDDEAGDQLDQRLHCRPPQSILLRLVVRPRGENNNGWRAWPLTGEPQPWNGEEAEAS